LGTADVDYAGFFPGEGNIDKGGKTYYLPENKLFSTRQVEKHTILAGKRGGPHSGHFSFKTRNKYDILIIIFSKEFDKINFYHNLKAIFYQETQLKPHYITN